MQDNHTSSEYQQVEAEGQAPEKRDIKAIATTC